MKKETLLYASPFPPMESGISDYSERLVAYLDKYFDITLYIDDYRLSNPDLYERYKVITSAQGIIPEEYDYRIYNIGNNPGFHSYLYRMAIDHPGMIILHDFSLYYLFTGYHQSKGDLYSALYKYEGRDTFLDFKEIVEARGINLLEYKDLAGQYALNKELLKSNNKIMVHSEYAYNKVSLTAQKVKKINMIPQIQFDEKIENRDSLLKKYGIPDDSIIVASFGMIAPTKLNIEICESIIKIAKTQNKPIIYLMVGEGGYADSYVDNKLIFKTGFTTIEEFDSFIEYSDIIVNLRNPTMGETSAAMLRILQKGKPCITNNGGWFSELPDECVCKVDLDNLDQDLERSVLKMVDDSVFRQELGQNANEYFEKEYNPEIISEQIYQFVTERQTS